MQMTPSMPRGWGNATHHVAIVITLNHATTNPTATVNAFILIFLKHVRNGSGETTKGNVRVDNGRRSSCGIVVGVLIRCWRYWRCGQGIHVTGIVIVIMTWWWMMASVAAFALFRSRSVIATTLLIVLIGLIFDRGGWMIVIATQGSFGGSGRHIIVTCVVVAAAMMTIGVEAVVAAVATTKTIDNPHVGSSVVACDVL
jgi:hypothetical protein